MLHITILFSLLIIRECNFSSCDPLFTSVFLSCGTACFSYDPGDVAVICPQNHPECVEDFISYMGLDGSQMFILHPAEDGLYFILDL